MRNHGIARQPSIGCTINWNGWHELGDKLAPVGYHLLVQLAEKVAPKVVTNVLVSQVDKGLKRIPDTRKDSSFGCVVSFLS